MTDERLGGLMTDRQPRLAVIIPCFNDGATIGDAVDSALAQEPAEIVVVDDGSTESATIEVLEHMRERGIRVMRQENAGPAAARMAGLRRTSARYVFPLDADDVLAPDVLPVLADALDADSGLAAVWGDYRMFGDARSAVRTPPAIDLWIQTYVNELPVSALFRRTALVAAGGWRLAIGYEDWDLWLSLAEQGSKGKRVPILVYGHRVHGRREWHTQSARHLQIVRELRRRHARLFASRRQNWARSTAPWRLKLGLPIASALPLPTRARLALLHSLSNPRAVVGSAVDKRLSGFRPFRARLPVAPLAQARKQDDVPDRVAAG